MSRDAASPAGARARRALAGGLLYGATGAGARLLYLVALPFVTHAVAPVVFGQYALIRVVLPALRTLSDLGTSTAAVRYGSGLAPERREVFGSVVFARVVTSCSLAALVVLVVRWLAPALVAVALLSGLALCLLAVTDALASACRAEERHAVVTLSHATSAVTEVVAILVLVAREHLGLLGLAASLALRFGAAFLVILPRALPLLGRPSFARYRALLRFGAPASLSQLVSTAGALDRLLVERLSSLSEVALYHLAAMPATAIEVFEQAVTLAAEPWVYGASEAERPRALARLVTGYFAVASAGAAGLGLFAPEIIGLVAPPSYAAALPVLPWLAFAAVAQGGFRLVGMASGAAHRTQPWAIAGVTELALAAVLLVLLVPRFGASAAGAGRFAASLVGVGLCYLLGRRVSGIALGVGRWLVFGVLAAVTSVAALAPRFGGVQAIGVRVALAFGTSVIAAALFLVSVRVSREMPAAPTGS